MGIFDQIGGASRPSGSAAHIRAGEYLVSIVANRHFKSNKPGNPDTFVVEAKIDKVLFEVGGQSNREGEVVSSVRVVKGDYADMILGDVRAYVAALLDVDFELVDSTAAMRAFEDDGGAFAALPMKVRAHDKPTKKGGTFTVVTWSQPTEGELALLEEIPLT